MATRQTLPVLPLRGTVIFPGLTAPIAAGRPGTLRAIESALRGERVVFAVAQRDTTDEPTPDILYQMGVIARIRQIQRGLGGVQLLLQGEMRATALQYTTTEGYMSARRSGVNGAVSRKRSSTRYSMPSRIRGASPISWRATSSCPSRKSRVCW